MRSRKKKIMLIIGSLSMMVLLFCAFQLPNNKEDEEPKWQYLTDQGRVLTEEERKILEEQYTQKAIEETLAAIDFSSKEEEESYRQKLYQFFLKEE